MRVRACVRACVGTVVTGPRISLKHRYSNGAGIFSQTISSDPNALRSVIKSHVARRYIYPDPEQVDETHLRLSCP